MAEITMFQGYPGDKPPTIPNFDNLDAVAEHTSGVPQSDDITLFVVKRHAL